MKPGQRKFTVAILILLLSTLLAMFEHVSGDNFQVIAVGVMGLYGLANIGEYLAKRQ